MQKKHNGGQDSMFKREVPKMPEGYYSGDQPNPHLREFVERHMQEKPYDPETDEYAVPAFDRPIETSKASAIYNMHTYWSKKPYDAVSQYICHYTNRGDLVLDPFCGSGGTALAALMEGRKAIAIDRSPAATFITKNYCSPVDVDELQAAFEELKARVKPEIDWLYETRCDRCGGKATTIHTVYSQVFQCPRCLERMPLSDCVEAVGRTSTGQRKKIKACPHCTERGIVEEISTRGERYGSVPVLVSYICENRCSPARDERSHNDGDARKRDYFQRCDVAKLREIEERSIPFWYPDGDLRSMIPYRMLYKKDFRQSDAENLKDLFTKRNLWALAALRDAFGSEDLVGHLAFCFTGILLVSSRMYRADHSGIMPGMYYLPPNSRENNVMVLFEKKAVAVAGALQPVSSSLSNGLCISTQSATNLNDIPDGAIDHIFTDPPYAGKVQYGELNFVWEAWLGFDANWQEDEIIVNLHKHKTEAEWERMMRDAMAECYRVLKPGRWLALCYHDTSEGTWTSIQDIMAEVGFLADGADRALFIDTGSTTYNQYMAEKSTKRDLVVNFRKPKHEEINPQLVLTGDEDESTFREKVLVIIREHLSARPGVTRDRIYDDVVSRMVRSGQMEAHDFDELLGQIAEPAEGYGNGKRWYLKESEEGKIDTAEALKEDAAAKSVSAMMEKWLSANAGETGVHYSDIFEYYIYAIKDKPRRELAEWLPDYFFRTEDGTWRLPADEDEQRLKEKARTQGHNRRIKRYLSYLQHGLPVPETQQPSDATLAEWIRHCQRSGLYEQGKLLYESGGLNLTSLSEEAAVEVDEDYQTCLRLLDREEKPTKAGSPKKPRDNRSQNLELGL